MIWSGAPPAVLDRWSQALSFVAVQVSDPVPPLEIFTVSTKIAELPALALCATLSGVTMSTGCSTVSVTGILTGEPVIAPASTTTVSVYVPAVRPAGFNVTMSDVF